jgi:hypothetical protein
MSENTLWSVQDKIFIWNYITPNDFARQYDDIDKLVKNFIDKYSEDDYDVIQAITLCNDLDYNLFNYYEIQYKSNHIVIIIDPITNIVRNHLNYLVNDLKELFAGKPDPHINYICIYRHKDKKYFDQQEYVAQRYYDFMTDSNKKYTDDTIEFD